MRDRWPWAILSLLLLPSLLAALLGPDAAARPDEPVPETPWAERRPFISLLLVGNQHGKLKPCGCTSPQQGGLERMAALVERLRHRAGEGYASISLGWTLRGAGEAQEESKADLFRRTLALLRFDAHLLGATDLAVPAMTQPREGGGALDRPRPPATVVPAPGGLLGAAGETEPLAAFEVRGLPIRALSVVDPDRGDVLRAAGVAQSVLSPLGALQRLAPRPDTLWVVGTDATPASRADLAQAMRRLGPSVLVDLTGGGADEADRVPLGAEPLVVSLADLGREVGVLDLEPGPDGAGWLASYRTVTLGPGLEEVESVLRPAVSGLFEEYKRVVKQRGYLAAFPTYGDLGGVRYVGSGACAECHPGIYRDWLQTPHARALGTLERIGYAWDPECVRCHVVGFERQGDGRWNRAASGFRDPRRTPYLGGVGCENCHGPGSAHAEDPLDASLWRPGGPNRRHPQRKGCMSCHDFENSPGFLDRYEAHALPAVDHRHAER